MKQKVVSIIFIMFVFFFFAISFFIPDKEFSYNENRNLAQKPELTIDSLFSGKFMEEYENYVTDQIFGRDEFVKISTNIKLLLGQKEINGVYFSKNYFVEKFQESDIDDELLNKTIGYLKEFLAKHKNAKIAIVPTAGGVIDGLYPKYGNNINQKEMIEDLYDEIGESSSIDIYQSLKNNEDKDIYYRTDHHWTTLGAYYGYESIAKAFNKEIVGLDKYDEVVVDDEFSGTIQSKVNYDIGYDTIYKYVPKFDVDYTMTLNEDSKTTTNSIYDESKLKTKEKYAVFLGGNNAITRIKNNSLEGEGKILIIKDSYAHSMTPFLINNYSEVVLMDLRYFMGSVNSFIDAEEFDDILIMYNLSNLVDDRNFVRINK